MGTLASTCICALWCSKLLMAFLVDMFCCCNQFSLVPFSFLPPWSIFPCSYSCPFPPPSYCTCPFFLFQASLVNEFQPFFFFSHYPLVWMPFFYTFSFEMRKRERNEHLMTWPFLIPLISRLRYPCDLMVINLACIGWKGMRFVAVTRPIPIYQTLNWTEVRKSREAVC